MTVEYFDSDVGTEKVVEALLRDGAAVVREEIRPELADAVQAELRPHYDAMGRNDECDFNGYDTARLSAILAISRTSAELIGHPRVMQVADAVLLPYCVTYRIGSSTAIEIHPGETNQRLHPDAGIYPVRIPGMELQVGALWALDEFTLENGATRVIPGSHRFERLRFQEEKVAIQVPMPKGSVLFFLGWTLHGGGANRSNAPRSCLITTYSLGWLRAEENHFLQVPRDVAESYPPYIQNLLDYQLCGTLGSYQYPDGSWAEATTQDPPLVPRVIFAKET